MRVLGVQEEVGLGRLELGNQVEQNGQMLRGLPRVCTLGRVKTTLRGFLKNILGVYWVKSLNIFL